MEENAFPVELLGRVMECLPRGGAALGAALHPSDSDALRSALLVNKTWFNEAIRVLWEKPSMPDLAAIEDINRRQLYARHVRQLIIEGPDETYDDQMRSLEFTHLRSIHIYIDASSVGFESVKSEVWIDQYIQPALEQFSCYAPEPTASTDIFQLLETRCPQLRSFNIGSQLKGLNSASLSGFIDRVKSLRQIAVVDGQSNHIDDRVLSSLVSHDNLDDVEIETCLTHDMFVNALQNVDRPFKNIESLRVGIESRAIPLLVPAIKRVRCLTLALTDGDTNPWPHLSSLTNLQSLDISYYHSAEMTANDFQAIKTMRLHHLDIRSLYRTLTAPTLTDDEFISVIETQPELKDINLEAEVSLTVRSLTFLGRACRSLETFSLYSTYDLSPWIDIEPSPPLFPHVWQFGMKAIEEINPTQLVRYNSKTDATKLLAQVIVGHMPDLQNTCFIGGDKFSVAVGDACDDIKEALDDS